MKASDPDGFILRHLCKKIEENKGIEEKQRKDILNQSHLIKTYTPNEINKALESLHSRGFVELTDKTVMITGTGKSHCENSGLCSSKKKSRFVNIATSAGMKLLLIVVAVLVTTLLTIAAIKYLYKETNKLEILQDKLSPNKKTNEISGPSTEI